MTTTTWTATLDCKRGTVDVHRDGCRHLSLGAERVGFSFPGQDAVDFAVMIRDVVSGKADDGEDNFPWKWHLAPCTR